MANPNYKFSLPEDDRNDPGMLQKALANIQLGKPESFGGVLRDPAQSNTRFTSFTTHTPPDITKHTRIVGVLGIEQKGASPQDDGWFLSDFAAFHYLLRPFTTAQTWLHCLDLDALVDEHKQYLHGNPFLERTVVLDQSLLDAAKDSSKGHPMTQVKAPKLKVEFTKAVREQCQRASTANPPENVLILMFGHGDTKSKGIQLGAGDRGLLKMQQFGDIFKGLMVNVTLLTTACYSGGWTCNPNLNISTLTAAGIENRSRSWSKSDRQVVPVAQYLQRLL